MKQCPQCNSTYNDETLSFCLNDGVALITGYDSEATVQIPKQAVPTMQGNPVRVQVPVNPPTVQVNTPVSMPNPVPKSGSKLPIILVSVVLLGFLLLGGAVLAYFVLSQMGGNQVSQNSNPKPFANSNAGNEKDKTEALQDEVNKLKKMIEEQSNANKKTATDKPASNTASTKPTPATTEIRIATVNSPGDGFLAMRSLPDTKTGVQLMKMPHGAQVAVGACKGPMVRSGRWCRVAYGGQTGWAFDAYLIYE